MAQPTLFFPFFFFFNNRCPSTLHTHQPRRGSRVRYRAGANMAGRKSPWQLLPLPSASASCFCSASPENSTKLRPYRIDNRYSVMHLARCRTLLFHRDSHRFVPCPRCCPTPKICIMTSINISRRSIHQLGCLPSSSSASSREPRCASQPSSQPFKRNTYIYLLTYLLGTQRTSAAQLTA